MTYIVNLRCISDEREPGIGVRNMKCIIGTTSILRFTKIATLSTTTMASKYSLNIEHQGIMSTRKSTVWTWCAPLSLGTGTTQCPLGQSSAGERDAGNREDSFRCVDSAWPPSCTPTHAPLHIMTENTARRVPFIPCFRSFHFVLFSSMFWEASLCLISRLLPVFSLSLPLPVFCQLFTLPRMHQVAAPHCHCVAARPYFLNPKRSSLQYNLSFGSVQGVSP